MGGKGKGKGKDKGKSKTQDDQSGTPVPTELLLAVSAARPTCKWFESRSGCRKGKSCSLAHGAQNDTRLPYVSRFQTADGADHITIRHYQKIATLTHLTKNSANLV